jgi:hypothetical protein
MAELGVYRGSYSRIICEAKGIAFVGYFLVLARPWRRGTASVYVRSVRGEAVKRPERTKRR